MTDRATRGGPAGAWLLAAVLIAAWLHALFYAVVELPWSLLNEPHHLDYVLTLKDTGRPPDIRLPVRPDVTRAVLESPRWRRAPGREPARSQTALGRGGKSYEGYQPPLYYASMVPVALLAGPDPERVMWAIRLVSTLTLPILAVVAWSLAGRWFPEHGLPARAAAGLAMASVPVAASSSSRVTNDGLVAALVAVGVLAVTQLGEKAGLRRAGVVGALVAAALLTKSSGAILLAPTALVVGGLWWRGSLAWPGVALTVAPGIVGAVTWMVWTDMRYGVPDGTSAFLAFFGGSPNTPRSPGPIVRELWWTAWSAPPWWRYGLGATQGRTMAVLAALVAIGGIGLARRPRPLTALAVTATVVVAAIAVAGTGSIQGLVPPVGRIALGAYPAIAALTAGGWARLAGGRAALAVATTAALIAVAYDVLVFAATARPWWFL